jgi:large subunit ribosomal protein L24
MNKLRKGDQVVVLSGRDKGRRGTVLDVLAEGKLLVEGINVVKKHQRGNPQANQPGGIIELAQPLHASKVAIWNPGSSKGDRVGIRTLADGRRVRFLKSSNEVIDVK